MPMFGMKNRENKAIFDMKNSEEYLISFEFTLCDSKDRVIDSNVDKEPMSFKTGCDEMLPALETELIQLEIGEKKRVFLSAEKAYGPIQKSNFRKFPLEYIPEPARQIGRKVMARAQGGNEEMVDVIDIRGDTVVLNFNHPLAGKDLRFDVKIKTKVSV